MHFDGLMGAVPRGPKPHDCALVLAMIEQGLEGGPFALRRDGLAVWLNGSSTRFKWWLRSSREWELA